MKTKKAVYISTTLACIVGLCNNLLATLKESEFVEDNIPHLFPSTSNESCFSWMRTDEMNRFYSGFIGETIQISAMIGMRDSVNTYLDEMVTVGISNTSIYLIEGTHFYILQSPEHNNFKETLRAVVEGIINKKIIQGVFNTPKD